MLCWLLSKIWTSVSHTVVICSQMAIRVWLEGCISATKKTQKALITDAILTTLPK